MTKIEGEKQEENAFENEKYKSFLCEINEK